MKFTEALDFLNSLSVFGIRPGLERINYASKLLGSPQNNYKTIHIAGTNGKGSTSTFVSYILKEAGINTGTYTSPYVFKPNERIQYNSENISDSDFGALFDEIKLLNNELTNSKYGSLTEFEAKTLAAFLYYKEKKVDYAVIETGMGGRFDATNIINPVCSIITSIGLDHTEYLGNTLSEIAFEKAGIIKKEIPCIVSCPSEALSTIETIAAEKKSKLYIIGKDFSGESRGDNFDFLYGNINIKDISPSLTGDFQHSNASLAIMAALLIKENITEDQIKTGIKKTFLPGRFQTIKKNPRIIIDGAHNQQAAENLLKTLEKISYKRLILIIGMLSNHSCKEFLEVIGHKADIIIATESSNSKATPAKDIAIAAKEYSQVLEGTTVKNAITQAQKIASSKDLILITGSFYTIGDINIDEI